MLFSSIGFIVIALATTSYVLLTHRAGEYVAEYFVENFGILYRTLFPNQFALENPRWIMQAIKFTFCVIFNVFGVGVAIVAWEARKNNPDWQRRLYC